MKLFGGKGAGKHSAAHDSAQTSPVPVAAAEVKAEEETQPSAPQQTGERTQSVPAEKRKSPNRKKPDIDYILSRMHHYLSGPGWKKLRKPLVMIGVAVLLLLIAIIAYSIWEKPPAPSENGLAVMETLKPAVSDVPIQTPPPEETEAPQETETPEVRKEDCYTFLLMAYDQLGANTDTIIVGRMDAKNGTIDVVNIPRDTLVNVPWGVKKINTILPQVDNEMSYFLDYLSKIIGFSVDCYAVVDIKAVEQLVNCIGGIYYNVPRDMDYDDPTQDLHIHIQKGYQLLYGEDVVKVLRFRIGNDGTGYLNGDLGRIQTQQDLLKTLAGQMLTLGNIPNLEKIIEIFENNVQTNLTASNIAFLTREFLMMDQENIRFHTLSGEAIGIRGGSYYQINAEEWVHTVNEYLNPFHEAVTLDHLDLLRQEGKFVISTTGEVIPNESFYNFYSYVAPDGYAGEYTQ